jgi:16S rRNA (guanine527-N7)-methyltransferase
MMSDIRHEIERELEDLRCGLDVLGIKHNKDIIQKFRVYLEVLFKKRNELHLLSHRDYKRISRRHFLTSLIAFEHIKGHTRVCDIGSGAGFPSMPLKIVDPHIELTLIEAQGKKVDFLRFLIKELAYNDVNIVYQRVEDYSDKVFEVILLRAVGKIKKLVSSVDRLLEPGGKAIFFKSLSVEKELAQLNLQNFHVKLEKTMTPLEQAPLALVILCKNI